MPYPSRPCIPMTSWKQVLGEEKKKTYFQAILTQLAADRARGKVVYPSKEHIFNAFVLTPFQTIKVVILGQDPYHGPGQAHGLSFSVPPGVPLPPSLKNIYQELTADIDTFTLPGHGSLMGWAKQGVFLLNTVLTVEHGKAHSHAHLGWETFTDYVLSAVNHHLSHIVFLLWGSFAGKKSELIDSNKHCILKAAHPSPLSAHRGFLGCKAFSTCNQYRVAHGLPPINWAYLPRHFEED